MPARAQAFYERLTKLNYQKGHVYHTTTKARVMQARFFLDHLTEEAKLETPQYLDDFDKRDMFLFGLVNSLRSALDSFTYELVLFYGGSLKGNKNLQFTNLLNSNITLPLSLHDQIHKFRYGNTFGYLNKLRNAQQHRNYPLMRIQAVALMSLDIIGPDSEGTSANWFGDNIHSQERVESKPAIASRSEPDLRLPDDPNVEPGDETYSPGRLLFSTTRYLYSETREFILSSYELAT